MGACLPDAATIVRLRNQLSRFRWVHGQATASSNAIGLTQPSMECWTMKVQKSATESKNDAGVPTALEAWAQAPCDRETGTALVYISLADQHTR